MSINENCMPSGLGAQATSRLDLLHASRLLYSLVHSAMSPVVLQRTPTKTSGAYVVESPGNWEHPHLQEIHRRRARTLFNEDNVKIIVFNVIVFLFITLIRPTIVSAIPEILMSMFSSQVRYYFSWAHTLSLLFPVTNVIGACLPLLRAKDNLEDIPLTPAQRNVLGLPPSSRPPMPAETIFTPPRYSRTPSLSGSPASYKSLPLANSGSPASDRRPSGSPMATSPLLQKAIGGGRRNSFGSPSSLGVRLAGIEPGSQSTSPMSTPAKRASFSLTNKWLYEKGRRSPSNSMQLHHRQNDLTADETERVRGAVRAVQ